MIRYYVCMVVLALLSIAFFHETRATGQGTSDNFRIDESFFGPGGGLDASSSSYQFQSGQQSVGSPGAVAGESANYSSQGGSSTASEPSLSCIINTATVNLGSLSTSVSATATAAFSVSNQTSYGYIVSIVGNPPSDGSHTLDNMDTNDASQAGVEQFGINLAANTAPTAYGANPVQVPDGSFSSGAAATNYNTTNSYRYNSGETIAAAAESSGQTDYTISYLVNASNTTPAGAYAGSQAIVCTGTY